MWIPTPANILPIGEGADVPDLLGRPSWQWESKAPVAYNTYGHGQGRAGEGQRRKNCAGANFLTATGNT